jgi:hypothetical protein
MLREAVTDIGKQVQAKAGAYAIVVAAAAMPQAQFEPGGGGENGVPAATIWLISGSESTLHIDFSPTPERIGSRLAVAR